MATKHVFLYLLLTFALVLANKHDSSSSDSTPERLCGKEYGLSVPDNMIKELVFCNDHAGRTCCDAEDSKGVKVQVSYLRQKTDISTECLEVTSQVLCGKCDGLVGMGKLEGLCPNIC